MRLDFASFIALTSIASFPSFVSSQKNFSAVTFNVGGLPAIINSNGSANKTENTLEIGRRFAQAKYDVIHVQEDFNYHASLYSTDNHAYRTPTSGGIPFGSGLNTLSNFPFENFSRSKWEKCDISEGDCLTPKGFSFMTVNISSNVQIDFYNLHTDAGNQKGDSKARVANFDQVTKAILSKSKDRPVVVMGDTNARYTRTEDQVGDFVSKAGLIDSWVQLHRNGQAPAAGAEALLCAEPLPANNSCEVVDKVFFKNGSGIQLQALSWNYIGAEFLNSTGGALSDHVPIQVDFSCSLS